MSRTEDELRDWLAREVAETERCRRIDIANDGERSEYARFDGGKLSAYERVTLFLDGHLTHQSAEESG